MCPQPVSDNGTITVRWSYIHNGGLPLSDVSVQYRFQEGSLTVTKAVFGVSITDVTVEVHNLVVGQEYTFTGHCREHEWTLQYCVSASLPSSG